ncbi:MAG: NADH-quinone oxidoreductase subunit NuoK [Desulfobulbus sp.]|nr:MAG: NADH-quinone oxidoreductase subunit NuoK [Desulfobulbus sp.]
MIPLSWYMSLAAILFAIGVCGFLTRRNLIMMFLSIELMLNAVNLNMVALSHYLESMRGQVFTFFIITVAAAEAAIGLGIAITLYRSRKTVHVDEVNQLKG